jgi:short subunit dehydrogenase-like uncharacterized protein
MSARFLIYGANGYTGELIAREARARGLAPVLGGRNAPAVAALARELGVDHAAFALDDPAAVAAALARFAAVLHCAGPFSRTAGPMAAACLRARVHYLDVTGEVEVFEGLAARDAEARAAGVMLLPGVGFDVVPSDCLAAHVKHRLPSATRLVLAWISRGGMSRGTATTAAENIHRGGLVRRGGVLARVPTAWKTRPFDFGDGHVRTAVTIPWGDIATAWRSTRIPDIEVYMAVPKSARVGMRLARYARPLLALGPVRALIRRYVRSGSAGPDAEARTRGWTRLRAEATAPDGTSVVSRLKGPEGYTFTMYAALLCLERVLRGDAPPGYQTPATAYGPDLVLEVPGVAREDVA